MGQNQSEDARKSEQPSTREEEVPQQQHQQNYQNIIASQKYPNNSYIDQIDQQNKLIKSRSSNYNQGQFNSMTQSIPNLKSFQEQRSVNESERQLRESEGSRKPPFQKQNAKHLKKDINYKKNLYSAMTSRVLKQQQENQLNNSQILHSQRSLTSLSMNNSHVNQQQQTFQRCQSPMDVRGRSNLDVSQNYDKQHFDSSFVQNYNNPLTMKKQYSEAVSSSSKKGQPNIHQDFSISTQVPPHEQVYNNIEHAMIQNGKHKRMGPAGLQGLSQKDLGGFPDSHSFTIGQNDYEQNPNNVNMKMIQQQLYKNYEKAMHLTSVQQNYSQSKSELMRVPSKDQQKQYDSHQQNAKRDSYIQQQNLMMGAPFKEQQYQSFKPPIQSLQYAKERDSGNILNPPYKIRVKNGSITPEQLMNQSMGFSGFSQIKREINFGGLNCPLEPNIAMTILLYDMHNFRKYLCLTPQWHHLILEAMDDYFKKVEVDFVMKNYEYLMFKKSYTNSSIIQFCGQKGIRVDRVIVCEILENSNILNKCLRVSYSYKYTNAKSEKDIFVADFKLDITKPHSNRVVWIHKDEQEQINQQRQYQISDDLIEILRRPYVQPITQICAKDTIEIAINLYCLQGLVDIESIEWLDCSTTIPPKYNVINYDKDVGQRAASDKAQKIYCDMSRICELEDAVVEWYDSRYFQRQNELLNIDYLEQLFTIKKYECAGIDGLICKIQMQATKEGRLYNEFLGIPIVVKNLNNKSNSLDDDKNLVNEVKRLGLLIDRYVDLELRLGDTLVIYISRGSS